MLIEFSIENFLSFKDSTTLSMVAAKSFKEHPDTHVIESGSNFKLLKSAVIYGNNASGKSNLLEAMGFMKQTILNSFRDALLENNEKKFPLEKFALNTRTEKETSFFEISFIQKGTKALIHNQKVVFMHEMFSLEFEVTGFAHFLLFDRGDQKPI